MLKVILLQILVFLPLMAFAEAPAKTISMPKSNKGFGGAAKTLRELGDGYCQQMIEYAKIVKAVESKADSEAKDWFNANLRLSGVICKNAKFVGHSAALDSNERVIVNFGTLKNAIGTAHNQIISMGGLIQGKNMKEFVGIGTMLDMYSDDLKTYSQVFYYSTALEIYAGLMADDAIYAGVYALEGWAEELNVWVRAGSL